MEFARHAALGFACGEYGLDWGQISAPIRGPDQADFPRFPLPGDHQNPWGQAAGVVECPLLPCRTTDARTAPEQGSALQLKARLPGISPMIRRRVSVPRTMSLHELHGVLQVAMGWEATCLSQLCVRGVVHAGPYLCGQTVDLPLSDFRFRRNAKFGYVYDMGCWWEHELRVEDRVSAASAERHPVCIGGSGACPPEECGGPDGYHARREEVMSLDAMMDLDRVAGFIERIVIQRDLSGLEDEDERWHAEAAADRCRSRFRFLEDKFLRGPVNRQFRAGRHRQLMHQQIM